MAIKTGELIGELKELIAALDRRVPRVEQAGEATIAREAAALRAKAVTRLAELTRQHTPDTNSLAQERPAPRARESQ